MGRPQLIIPRNQVYFDKQIFNAGQVDVITQQPQSLAVTQGETATFSVAAIGEPLTYQWRFGTTPVTNLYLNSYASFFSNPVVHFFWHFSEISNNIPKSGSIWKTSKERPNFGIVRNN